LPGTASAANVASYVRRIVVVYAVAAQTGVEIAAYFKLVELSKSIRRWSPERPRFLQSGGI
jgi:hypothetical protein